MRNKYLLVSHGPYESSHEAMDQLEEEKENQFKNKWFWVTIVQWNTTDVSKVRHDRLRKKRYIYIFQVGISDTLFRAL